MRPIYLYNTESRKKEKLSPINDNLIKMYTCGPTVYNFAHIGNFRTYVFEDVLRRTIKFFGMEIFHVMNLTDVDDKTIRGAIQNHQTLDDFTAIYKKAFFEDLDELLLERAEVYPEATVYIPQMIVMIEKLLQNGHAYTASDGSVYFKISSFPRYGRLSHLEDKDLKPAASERIVLDEYDKESISDFVLWKAYDPERDGNIFWESPFGNGRPGWHIECSAMARALLGDTLDIHVGGVDNLFPHHENEIAQSECCTGTLFVKHWLHSEHLLVNHKKMSKSLGNFYTIRDLMKLGYLGKEVRFALMQGHYRMQLNFSLELLDASRESLRRLQDCVDRVRREESTAQDGSDEILSSMVKEAERSFEEALADDLNLPQALSAVFDLVRSVHQRLDEGTAKKGSLIEVLLLFKKWNQVLGILSFEDEAIPQEVKDLAEQREVARKEKKWALSDDLRKQISAKGYVVEDSPQGAVIRKGSHGT